MRRRGSAPAPRIAQAPLGLGPPLRFGRSRYAARDESCGRRRDTPAAPPPSASRVPPPPFPAPKFIPSEERGTNTHRQVRPRRRCARPVAVRGGDDYGGGEREWRGCGRREKTAAVGLSLASRNDTTVRRSRSV